MDVAYLAPEVNQSLSVLAIQNNYITPVFPDHSNAVGSKYKVICDSHWVELRRKENDHHSKPGTLGLVAQGPYSFLQWRSNCCT